MKSKVIIVSGYFNPIHKGHLEYFNKAKAIADKLSEDTGVARDKFKEITDDVDTSVDATSD